MIRGTQKHQCVDHYINELCEGRWEAFKETQVQSTSEAERQKQHYDRKANAISLELGDMVLAKADTYGGRRKLKNWWEKEPYEVDHQVVESIPSYLVKNQWISMAVQVKWARWTTTTLEEQTQKSETEEAPQSVNCLSLAQHQTGKTPLGWVNRRLCAFIQIFPRASWIDKG